MPVVAAATMRRKHKAMTTKQSSSRTKSTRRICRDNLNHHPADAPWVRNYSPRQVVELYERALDAATLRHKTSQAVTLLMGEAFLALHRHGIDFTELPGYRSDGCPERPGLAHGSEAAGLKATLRWAAHMRREIKAEVHRRTVGVAVLVSDVTDPAPRPVGSKRKVRRKPLMMAWDRSSPPSPLPPPSGRQ